jgi:hypothetical protein
MQIKYGRNGEVERWSGGGGGVRIKNTRKRGFENLKNPPPGLRKVDGDVLVGLDRQLRRD